MSGTGDDNGSLLPKFSVSCLYRAISRDDEGHLMRNLLKEKAYILTSVLAGAFLFLVLLEFSVRPLFPNMTHTSIVSRLTHEWNTWARPDAEFHHVGDGVYQLRFPDQSTPDRNRILIIGDSFVMGHGVGETRRFGHLLQEHLRGANVTVLATTSYSPIIYRNILVKALSLATYRAVIVFVDQTDPADDLIYSQDLRNDGSGRFDVGKMRDRQRVTQAAYVHMLKRLDLRVRSLVLVNLLFPLSLQDYFQPGDPHYTYVSRSLNRDELIRHFNNDPASDDAKRMLSLTLRNLDEVASLCREHQVPLFLAANPWEFQSSRWPRVTLQLKGPFPKENRLETILKDRFGTKPGVYVLPLTHSFVENDAPSGLFLDTPPHEVHWNANGHTLVESVLRHHLVTTLPGLR
jgi:hypothetical protein